METEKYIVWIKSIQKDIKRRRYLDAMWTLGAMYGFLNTGEQKCDHIITCVVQTQEVIKNSYEYGDGEIQLNEESEHIALGYMNIALNELRVMDY